MDSPFPVDWCVFHHEDAGVTEGPSRALVAPASSPSLTLIRIRIPSQPNSSALVFITYWSIPPCYTIPSIKFLNVEKRIQLHTLLIVFKARVVSLTFINSFNVSENNRFDCTFGSHVLLDLCFENGTLFPYCFVFPWNKPSWDLLKGDETMLKTGIEGIMVVATGLGVFSRVGSTWVANGRLGEAVRSLAPRGRYFPRCAPFIGAFIPTWLPNRQGSSVIFPSQ